MSMILVLAMMILKLIILNIFISILWKKMIWCEYIGGNKKHLSDKINYMYKMGIIKQINVEDQTYYFYNDIIELENFDSSLLKIDKKNIETSVFTILDVLQLQKLVIVKIFTVWILCIYVLITEADILEKKV